MSIAFSARGQRLWNSLVDRDETLGDDLSPLRDIALSACRTADRLEELERIALEVDPIVESRGGVMVHPVHAEVRQQAAALARLITALRLPDDATGKKPQVRGMRGAQKPSNLGATVSSMDALRRRSEGA